MRICCNLNNCKSTYVEIGDSFENWEVGNIVNVVAGVLYFLNSFSFGFCSSIIFNQFLHLLSCKTNLCQNQCFFLLFVAVFQVLPDCEIQSFFIRYFYERCSAALYLKYTILSQKLFSFLCTSDFLNLINRFILMNAEQPILRFNFHELEKF